MNFAKVMAASAIFVASCSGAESSQADSNPAATMTSQRAQGHPYAILGTRVFDLTDPASQIPYQIFVSLPPSYEQQPQRRYPTVYVTDADYGFPMLRLIGRRLNGARPQVEEFIIVGLSYEKGQDPMVSRRRDYTPTAKGASDAPSSARHGESLRYRNYIRDVVIPFVDGEWRTQTDKRVYVGHSYGGLLGAQILLTESEIFDAYILGSPSFWYDKKYLLREAPGLLDQQHAINADVYLYVGEFEALRTGDNRYQQEVDMVVDNRAFADILRSRGYRGLKLQADVLADEDHMSVAPRGFTQGLLYTLPAKED